MTIRRGQKVVITCPVGTNGNTIPAGAEVTVTGHARTNRNGPLDLVWVTHQCGEGLVPINYIQERP